MAPRRRIYWRNGMYLILEGDASGEYARCEVCLRGGETHGVCWMCKSCSAIVHYGCYTNTQHCDHCWQEGRDGP